MRSIDELASEICTLSGHINAANHRWLLLVAEYDRRDGWSDGTTQSCAHWLNWRCGIAMGAAREKVRVARALEKLPKISAAMASGSLSYSKVREITRVASAETEDYLLMIAEHGTAAQVEKLVRTFRRCQEVEELSRNDESLRPTSHEKVLSARLGRPAPGLLDGVDALVRSAIMREEDSALRARVARLVPEYRALGTDHVVSRTELTLVA